MQGERFIGNFPDQGLNEAVLPSLGRPRVALDLEDLPPDQRAENGLDLLRRPTNHRTERLGAKRKPENRAVLEERTIVWRQGVQARCDE